MRVMLVTLAITFAFDCGALVSPALIVFSDAGFAQAIGASVRQPCQLAVNERLWCCHVWPDRLRWFWFHALCFICCRPEMVLTTVMLLVVPLTAIRMISDYVCYRRVFHREERVTKVAGAG